MLKLDVMLKFWELLVALGIVAVMVVGALVVILNMKRRSTQPVLYVEAGGVVLSLGEERLLELIARANGQDRNLSVLARTLNADEIAVYSVARELKQKELIIEVADPSGGLPRFELSPAGNEAALARSYIKLT